MALAANNTRRDSAQPPISEAEVEDAFQAMSAMLWVEEHRQLQDNPYFQALKDTAKARFRQAWDLMG